MEIYFQRKILDKIYERSYSDIGSGATRAKGIYRGVVNLILPGLIP
jgi:hypothetical protein